MAATTDDLLDRLLEAIEEGDWDAALGAANGYASVAAALQAVCTSDWSSKADASNAAEFLGVLLGSAGAGDFWSADWKRLPLLCSIISNPNFEASGLLSAVNYLLVNGVDVHATGGTHGSGALHALAASDIPPATAVRLALVLIDHGALPNAEDDEFRTACMIASELERGELADTLRCATN